MNTFTYNPKIVGKIIKDDELNKLSYKQLLKIAKKKNIEL